MQNDQSMIRTKPRPSETISLGGRTKWRLDALCLAGRRSRTGTIEVLIDFYLKHNPAVRDFVAERANDPKPIQLKRARVADAAETETL
jgi:hypothetical protein